MFDVHARTHKHAHTHVQVTDVQDTEVLCVAKNNATLEGLLCVFHCERNSFANLVSNIQNELPLLSDWDKECIQVRACLRVRVCMCARACVCV
jgi:pyruvate kinase